MGDRGRRPVTGELRLGIPEDYAFPLTTVPANVDRPFRAVRLQVIGGASVKRVQQAQGGEVIRREPRVRA